MKINRVVVLLSFAIVSLAGCQKKTTPSESIEESTVSESSEEEVHVKDESQYTYENRIEEPSSTIHNMEDFKLITDYHAFYKDTDSFDVTVAPDYVYETKQKTVDSEINYLYWYGELVNGVMGISGTKKNDNTWTINYQFYNNAYIDGHPTTTMLTDLFYQEPQSNRDAEYNDFATEDVNKQVVDVATTQQLWYAAEHGYRVNPIEGSLAEKYYEKAKDLLRQIVSDDMSDYQKTATIYDYIEHHASYCYEALDLPDGEDPVHYPDVYCARHKSFFIEGFFDNHSVVCDGYSKIYTLLGRMEGLEIVRGSGTSDQRWQSKEVAGHAYCFVKIDNQYYLSCPTWGQQRVNMSKFVLNKQYFLSPREYMDSSYPCIDWTDLEYAKSTNSVNYFKNIQIVNGEKTLSPYVNSGSLLDDYVELLNGEANCFVDLYFQSVLTKREYKNSMKAEGFQVIEINNSELVVYNG